MPPRHMDLTPLIPVVAIIAFAAVMSAVVTVRAGSGEVLYSARDSFRWQPVD